MLQGFFFIYFAIDKWVRPCTFFISTFVYIFINITPRDSTVLKRLNKVASYYTLFIVPHFCTGAFVSKSVKSVPLYRYVVYKIVCVVPTKFSMWQQTVVLVTSSYILLKLPNLISTEVKTIWKVEKRHYTLLHKYVQLKKKDNHGAETSFVPL